LAENITLKVEENGRKFSDLHSMEHACQKVKPQAAGTLPYLVMSVKRLNVEQPAQRNFWMGSYFYLVEVWERLVKLHPAEANLARR
jgi:hypothetical protein